jgi:hypothetical protein
MKVNELRIGDLIYLELGLPSLDIHKIQPTDFKNIENDKNVQPIPLTEEWLRKFHSDEEIEKSVRFPNEITIYDRFLFIWKEHYKYWYVVTAYHKEYLTKIEFVHEYQ